MLAAKFFLSDVTARREIKESETQVMGSATLLRFIIFNVLHCEYTQVKLFTSVTFQRIIVLRSIFVCVSVFLCVYPEMAFQCQTLSANCHTLK